MSFGRSTSGFGAADAVHRRHNGKRRVGWSIGAAFVVPFLLLILIAAYGAWQNRRALDARNYVARVAHLQALTLQMEAAAASMELHHRGFLLTGAPREIDARNAAYRRGATLAAELRRSTSADRAQAHFARGVQTAFDRRYRYMRTVEAAVERAGLAVGRQWFRPDGAGSVDRLLRSLSEMRAAQVRLLAQSSARADRRAGRFQRVLVYGTAIALALLSIAAVMLYRQLRRTEKLGNALAAAHQEQLDRAQDLQHANHELEAFSYTVSHDLRAPLRHIDGYAQMLREDGEAQLTGDMRRYLDTISESARRMGALIDDLLAFSRLGRKPVERVDIDMHHLVQRVLEDAGAGCSQARIHVAPLPRLTADPMLMRQVWLNLVANAIKYSRGRGDASFIEIDGERDGALVRYRIRDNGVGFDMRYADKLFGVFQRLHSDDEFEGTGVGLAIVHRIVTRHGGRIHADARLGEGACFTLEFPVEVT